MLRYLTFLCGLLCGVILSVAYQGRTGELFAETGQCRFGTAQDGTFYQSDQHTDNFMHPACASVGIAGKWKDSERWGWRAAFLAAGSIQARGNMAVNDETRGSTAPCNMNVSEANCAIRFDGAGNTFGITLSATYEQPLFANTSLIVESGLFFFQHHFKSEARFVDCCHRTISYNETSRIWDQPSPMAGVTLRYRSVYVSYRHYWPSEHRALSLTDFSFNQYAIGVIAAKF